MATDSKSKGKKAGRNLPKCQAYRLKQRREQNKLRRLAKHMDRNGFTYSKCPPDVRAAYDKLMAQLPNTVISSILKERARAA